MVFTGRSFARPPAVLPHRKLGEWDDEDGFGPTITEEDKANAANKHGRVVVLKRMFTLQELEEDKSLLLDLKDEVREECASLGEVTNVVLYDVRCAICCIVAIELTPPRPAPGRARRRHDGQVQGPSQRAGMRHREC